MRQRLLAVIIGVTLVSIGCGVSEQANLTSPTTAVQSSSGDSPTTAKTGGTTVKTTGDKPTETKRNKNAKPYAEALDLSMADIQDYWAETMPKIYDGQKYKRIPADKLYPVTPKTTAPGCSSKGGKSTYEDVKDNAFYCSLGGFVAWDDEKLLPELYTEFGEYAIAMVFAHEWGHAIQDQIGIMDKYKSILIENQADCFAGAWTAHTLDKKNDKGFRASAADLQSAVAGMLKFRDTPGSDVKGERAHGSGFDRVNGFSEGFEQGAARCAQFPDNPPTFTNIKFSSQNEVDSGGNLSYEDAVKVSTQDLNAYWGSLTTQFTAVDAIQKYSRETAMPKCGAKQYSEDEALNTAFFCVDDNYVAWDEDMMKDVAVEIGDMGVGVLLAKQWAISAQVQDGQSKEAIASKQGNLQQSCFTGSWVKAVLNGDKHQPVSADGNPQLTLSPGDLDEAVRAFLAFSETPDKKGETATGSAFEQIEAFRVGFLSDNGPKECASYSAKPSK